MFKNNNKSTNMLILILGISIIGSLIFMIISNRQQKDKLQVYDGNDKVDVIETTEKEIDITTNTYIDDDGIFQVQIPEGWERVVKGDTVEFIHTPSATSVKISKHDYDPSVNCLDSSYLSASMVDAGYTFVSCDYISNTSSEIVYQKTGNKTYDFIEENLWCKEYIATLLFTFDDANYEKMSPYLDKIFNSFTWSDDVTQIPEGYYLSYLEMGDFEFLVPDTWTMGAQDNSVVCANQENTAQMIVTVQEYDKDLSTLTTYDMTSLIKPGRENGFMITNSTSAINKATADVSYLAADGTNMFNKTYLFANGYYLYSIQFDYIANSIDDSVPKTCSEFFREFVTKKIQEEEMNSPTNATPTDATDTDAKKEG